MIVKSDGKQIGGVQFVWCLLTVPAGGPVCKPQHHINSMSHTHLNSSPWEVKAGRSEVHGHPQLY